MEFDGWSYSAERIVALANCRAIAEAASLTGCGFWRQDPADMGDIGGHGAADAAKRRGQPELIHAPPMLTAVDGKLHCRVAKVDPGVAGHGADDRLPADRLPSFIAPLQYDDHLIARFSPVDAGQDTTGTAVDVGRYLLHEHLRVEPNGLLRDGGRRHRRAE